jgi:hypothetical protein
MPRPATLARIDNFAAAYRTKQALLQFSIDLSEEAG